MARIKVDPDTLSSIGGSFRTGKSNVQTVSNSFFGVVNSLDWDVRYDDIVTKNSKIRTALDDEVDFLSRLATFMAYAEKTYEDANKPQNDFPVGKVIEVGADVIEKTTEIRKMFKNGILNREGLNGLKVIYKASGKARLVVTDKLRAYMKENGLGDIKTKVYKGAESIHTGAALYTKNASIKTRFKSAFSLMSFKGFFKDTFSVVKDGKVQGGVVLNYVMIGVDVISSVYNNIKTGASTGKIVGDATAEVAKGVGGMIAQGVGSKVGGAIGMAIGSAICPGLGTVVGKLVGSVIGGAVAGFVYDKVVDGVKIGGKTVKEHVSSAVEGVYNGAAKAAKGLKTAFYSWIQKPSWMLI